MTDLVAQERKFVAYSRLKKAEKFNFSLNLVPIKSVLLLPFFLKDPVEILVKTKPKAIFDPCSLSGHSSSQEKERIQKGKDTKSET